MMEIVNYCVDCPAIGLPCQGEGCRNYGDKEIYYCNECEKLIDEDTEYCNDGLCDGCYNRQFEESEE